MSNNQLIIIKVGGNVLDSESVFEQVLDDFAKIKTPKILVHGGGKIADDMLKRLNIEPKKIEGRRITDEDTLDVVTMVYGGLINKKIVAQLQARGCNALGLTGADANAIRAHKRDDDSLDYGFAGDVDKIKSKRLKSLLDLGFDLVFAPITHDKCGQLLNTNADTVASTLAVELSKYFDVTLKYVFEKKGVLENPNDDDSVIKKISMREFEKGRENGSIHNGMIPKLQNAFDAMLSGVQSVVICGSEGVRTTVGTRLAL
ncbi:MAG: acetylglutamate kinase [Saprospiraceae bacterium]|nr:acetylglutamate kinase [Saprospiraceae bacterium]